MDRSAWNGKFKMTEQRNVEEFLGKLGVPAAQIKAIKAMELTNEITSAGDDYTMKQTSGGKENIMKVTLDKESTVQTLDGMVLKGVVTIDANNEMWGKYEDGIVEHMVIDKDGVITDKITKDGTCLVRLFKRC
ncbi:fatty acid-binding protein, liver-type-like [Styela clava]